MDELDRIEGAIDPYGDPDLLEQWSSCISNIMQHQANQSAASAHAQSGKSVRFWPELVAPNQLGHFITFFGADYYVKAVAFVPYLVTS